MAEIKKDNRVPVFIIGLIGATSLLALVAFAAFGVVGVLSVIGFMLLVFGGFLIWLFRFYRCPSCHRRLTLPPATTALNQNIRHHCRDCDITWDCGVAAVSIGES
jgi:hypothetical protein